MEQISQLQESIITGLENCIRKTIMEGNRSQRVGEKIARHIGRATGKYEKKPEAKMIADPEKRIIRKMIPVGKRYGRFHGHPKDEQKQRLTIAAKFLQDNYDKSEQELIRLVKSFPYKQELHSVVDHMIATALGGWRKEGNQLVNETGHVANQKNWALSEEGRLYRNGKQLSNINKLSEFRRLTNEGQRR